MSSALYPNEYAACPDIDEDVPQLAANHVLTVNEVAALLRIERKTAYNAIARGEMPGVQRIGGVIRISREAVLTWLSQGQGRVLRSRRKR